MRDFPGFWIVFKYGVIQLENPQEFKIGLAGLKIFAINQKLYTYPVRCTRMLIVVAKLCYLNGFFCDFVNDSVLIVDSAGPIARKRMF